MSTAIIAAPLVKRDTLRRAGKGSVVRRLLVTDRPIARCCVSEILELSLWKSFPASAASSVYGGLQHTCDDVCQTHLVTWYQRNAATEERCGKSN